MYTRYPYASSPLLEIGALQLISIDAGLSVDFRLIVAGDSGTFANSTELARERLDSPISFFADTYSL